jgi:CTP:molybdopterin cytidylyltransferase MocA
VKIAGLLLAAGAGTRFRAAGGGSKLLALVDGRPLIERPLHALSDAGLGEIVVVLGADADDLQAQADLSDARVLVHPGWADGMASSLAAGLASLPDDCEAAIVVLGDGPGLEREAVRRVAARIALGDAPLVGARYASGRGHPTAIHRSLWSRLPQVGEDGARALGAPRVDVDCRDLRPPGDADTPAELEGLDARP